MRWALSQVLPIKIGDRIINLAESRHHKDLPNPLIFSSTWPYPVDGFAAVWDVCWLSLHGY